MTTVTKENIEVSKAMALYTNTTINKSSDPKLDKETIEGKWSKV